MRIGKEPHLAKKMSALSSRDIGDALGVLTPEDASLLSAEDFQEFQDFDEYLNRLHKEYRIEINWDNFSEPQIQELIAILFHSIGYYPENLHKADRAREEGADLVLKKRNHSIALAVKIKPKNIDRQQLSDLSKRDEDEKIYVYIRTPSGKFRDSMGEYKGIVDFWNRDKINNFFVTNNLGFTVSLIFDDNDLSQTVRQAQKTLFGLLQKCRRLKKRAPAPLDRQSFKLLFRLKDAGVSLYKTNENVITLLEKPINFKRRELNEHFFKLFLEYLDILNRRLKSFLNYFDRFYDKNEDLINNSIIENDGRSHWLHLMQYRPDNSLPALKNELREAIKNNETLKKLKKTFPDKELENSWKQSAKNNDVWAVMESRVRNLMIFGAGIEAIVDDIVDEYARDYEKYVNL
jgi:hypothetical protein